MADSVETKVVDFMMKTGGNKPSAMMTQREAYAGMFLQAILSREKCSLDDTQRVWVAVMYADDLIAELEKTVEKE